MKRVGVIHACHSATTALHRGWFCLCNSLYNNQLIIHVPMAPTVLKGGLSGPCIPAGLAGISRETNMTEIRRDAETEPVGIVISRGSKAEAAPKFLAYVWGPAPEAVTEETSKAA